MTAPFSLFEPVDETSSWTTSFQGRSDENCFRSQFVSDGRSTMRPWLPRPIKRTDHWVAKFLAKVGMIEQVGDQFLPLVLFAGLQESPGFLNVGDSSQQVEIRSPQELVIGGRLCRLDSRLLPGLFNHLIDEGRPSI